jgi:hypothetical protein
MAQPSCAVTGALGAANAAVSKSGSWVRLHLNVD